MIAAYLVSRLACLTILIDIRLDSFLWICHRHIKCHARDFQEIRGISLCFWWPIFLHFDGVEICPALVRTVIRGLGFVVPMLG